VTMLAYHGDPAIKAKYLARVKAHREADVLTQGVGWESNGTTRGCAVGCTLEAYDHSRYPVELGIPEVIANLEDAIFEGLPRAEAMRWPEAFLKAIKPGSDLSMVWPRFAVWLLSSRGSPMFKQAQNETVKHAVTGVAVLYRKWGDTGTKPRAERFSAAVSAADAAANAANAASAAYAAVSAANAANAASAAYAAAHAAYAAADAASAAYAASAAADAAAHAAYAAADAAAWRKMSSKLITLLKGAK
jgi:hypothetical protein